MRTRWSMELNTPNASTSCSMRPQQDETTFSDNWNATETVCPPASSALPKSPITILPIPNGSKTMKSWTRSCQRRSECMTRPPRCRRFRCQGVKGHRTLRAKTVKHHRLRLAGENDDLTQPDRRQGPPDRVHRGDRRDDLRPDRGRREPSHDLCGCRHAG